MEEINGPYCDRCKATTYTSEWKYNAHFHVFKHTKMLEDTIDGTLHMCNWVTKIPEKV